jgi:uncharacterized protein YeaO (DUF488 family)
MDLRTRRVYDPPARSDGYRVLVDRIWPRGVSKEDARLDAWIKEVAPSDGLRKWYGHDPDRWPEFKEEYFAELRKNAEPVRRILDMAEEKRVTLLFGAKDEERNNAEALREYLETQATQ